MSICKGIDRGVCFVYSAPVPDETAPKRFSGARLRKARMRLSLSPRMLGERIGCTRISVYNWERGSSVPGGDTIPALAKALRRPIGYFYE